MEDSLEIDLSNPAEVAAQMPELRRRYERKLVERGVLDGQIELLRRLIGSAGAAGTRPVAAGSGSQKPRRRRVAPAQERAVDALVAAGGLAMSPTSLYKFMVANGLDAPKDASLLGVNLWDAWKAGRLMRAPNGVYTPLDGSGRTEWDRPLTDYYYAAELGFPTP
jgi:hypothetical protein